jgi:predicted aspartyl protease
MVLSFNYHRLPNKKGVDNRTPSIPITLNGRIKTKIQVYALIDSGADISVIPKALAEFLDLDLSGETNISYGIGGEIKVKESKMNITINKNHEEYHYTIPVQIILTGEEPPIILGRRGFFDKFVITIDERKQKIRLKKINDIH